MVMDFNYQLNIIDRMIDALQSAKVGNIDGKERVAYITKKNAKGFEQYISTHILNGRKADLIIVDELSEKINEIIEHETDY